MHKPLIGITCGDINGIGTELIIKTFSDNRILNALIIEMRLRNRFFVKVDQFVGSKYHGSAVLQNAMIRKGFDDQFRTNAVDIAAGNANYRFIHPANFRK